MKIKTTSLENFKLSYPLEQLVSLDKALFIDIETTGFTAKSSYLYLIGCAFYKNNHWEIRQWFSTSYEDEVELITSFFEFAKNYECLLHFNGNNFDLPFISQKCKQYNLPYHFDHYDGIDIYKRISPYKFFLKLPNCKQKTIELFLGIKRDDIFNSGELISLFHDYVKTSNEFSEETLFLHNLDDMKGMLNILPILSVYDLFNRDVIAKKVQANYYKDFNDEKHQELIISLTLPAVLPKSISASVNRCYFKGEKNVAELKVPIYEEELKFFYSNYKDYYYLPGEDLALHKSVSSFVDKAHRINATSKTCYTRKFSLYLPQWDLCVEPFFKRDYKSKELFFELTDDIKKDRALFSKYANHILHMIASTY